MRYFATVRRAITMPFSCSIFTTSWSESGLAEFSFLKISAIMSFTLVLDMPSPLAVWMPAVKKYFISNNALRRLHVFAGNRAADGGFMHADDFGNLHHRERLQKGDAFFHEVALTFNDFLGDVQDRLLALMQTLDQKFSGADFLADVIANLGGVFALRHQVLVGIADAQVRNVLVIGRDGEIVAGLFARTLPAECTGRCPAEKRGPGAVPAGAMRSRAHPALRRRSAPVPRAISGMRRLPSASMKSLHDAVFERLFLAGAFQLEQQALAQIPRADAGRIESLNDLQHFKNFFRRQPRGTGQFLDRGLEITVIIDVADEHLGDRAIAPRAKRIRGLAPATFPAATCRRPANRT